MSETTPVMGLIGFDRLRIECIIGVYPDERAVLQELFVSFRARTDFSRCVQEDHITQAVCYESLSRLCTTLAFEGKFVLLETYALHVLTRVLEEHPVTWAWIKIEKPGALRDAEAAVVELSMER